MLWLRATGSTFISQVVDTFLVGFIAFVILLAILEQMGVPNRVIGYLFKRLSYPLAPLVLAIVIGDKAEDAFRQSMLMSKGSLDIFVGGTLVTTLVVLSAALIVVPLILQAAGRRAPKVATD